MGLTLGILKNHATLAIGAEPSLSTGQTNAQRVIEICNQAGQYLYSRSWRFRERTTEYLDVVADQSYIELPDDVEELLSIVSTALLGYKIEMVTPDRMNLMQQNPIVTAYPGVCYGCLSRLPVVAGDALGAMVLEIWPPPTATASDAVAVRYRAAWVTIADDEDDAYEIPVPSYIDMLLIAYTRAIAQAYEDDGMSAKLAEIDGGPVSAMAETKDGLLQRDYGQLRVNPMNMTGYNNFGAPRNQDWWLIANPST